MKVLFLDAPYTGKVELCKKTLDFIKKNKVKNVALYASVQFVNKLGKVKEQLKKLKVNITTSKAARTHVESQLLGCVSYHESLNLSDLSKLDYFLYIGDGKFHPYALMYAQKESKDFNGEMPPPQEGEIKNNIHSMLELQNIKGVGEKTFEKIYTFVNSNQNNRLQTEGEIQPSFKLE